MRSMILASQNICVPIRLHHQKIPTEVEILGLRGGGTSTTPSSQINMEAPFIKTQFISHSVCFSVIKSCAVIIITSTVHAITCKLSYTVLLYADMG